MPFKGKRVLDFACGSSAIAESIAKLSGAAELIGIDANRASIERGRRVAQHAKLQWREKNDSGLLAASVDVAYTTDAFEHFEHPEAVLSELLRVVKPGGHILIHFIPWYGVEGAHLEGVIPIPWCHILFTERTLFRVAARVVRSDFYLPCAWDFDDQGQRRFELYDREGFDPAYLNRLTIRRFKGYIRPFLRSGEARLVAWEVAGFGGASFRLARYFRWASRLPGVAELANRGVYCALQKSVDAAGP